MSIDNINTIVFFSKNVLVSNDGTAVKLMPELVRELPGAFRTVAVWADDQDAKAVTRVYGDAVDQVMVENAEERSNESVLEELVRNATLVHGTTLFIDHHPKRCMAAVRAGVFAGIFEDASRLYRDLGVWGFFPFSRSLRAVEAYLGGAAGKPTG